MTATAKTQAAEITVVAAGINKATKSTKSAKTPNVAKSAKTADSVKVAKPRGNAKDLMANRRRMFFGASYMNGVLAGFHRDSAKMIQHALHLKVAPATQLKTMQIDTLREKLADAILSTPNGAEPFSIKLQ